METRNAANRIHICSSYRSCVINIYTIAQIPRFGLFDLDLELSEVNETLFIL